MRILHMTLHRRWFDAIAAGIKTEEYREIKPYWEKRLSKGYDVIEFRNGYSPDAPVMRVEFKGIYKRKIHYPVTGKHELVFAIKLGKLININYGKAKIHRDAREDVGAICSIQGIY